MEQCRECEVKDAEISLLYRRIQILGEVLQIQLNSLQQLQHPGGGSIEMCGTATEGAPIVTYPVVSHFIIPSMCTPPAFLSTNPPAGAQVATPTASDSMLQVQKTQQVDYCVKEESTYHGNKLKACSRPLSNTVELMAGSGVYVSLPILGRALAKSSTGTQLARRLMEMVWDPETLACSSPSPRPGSNYQQLDPHTIRAIEGYCLSFDKSMTSKEVLASMNNKCAQTRKRFC